MGDHLHQWPRLWDKRDLDTEAEIERQALADMADDRADRKEFRGTRAAAVAAGGLHSLRALSEDAEPRIHAEHDRDEAKW